ncbi:MAG: HlyD family efflux transporter periplasmic adaptor subunit [Bryobacteraceae bacterium]
MKKRLPILLLLAVAGGGYWYWTQQQAAANGNHLQISGNLELTQVDLSFKTAGRVIELTVREGEWVKKGQVIARLDATQLEQQKARDAAAVSGAQSQYQQLQTSIEYQKATIDSDINLRRAELAQVQARLDDLLAGSRSQEIGQAQAAVTDAKAANDFAKSEYERAQVLYSREDISTSQRDQSKTKVDSTAAQLRQAEQRLALVQEGPRKDEIVAARAAVARAQAAIATAEANKIEVRRKEEELMGRRADIDRNRATVGMTEAQLADTTIVAPIDGVVLLKAAEAGEVVAAGTTIVSIGDLDHPWLRAYINESDLGRVHLGQAVSLSTDSFKDKKYEGRISFIASEAEFTPKQIQTKEERVKLVYRVKIEVNNTAHELKNNMPVDAEIVL